MPEVPRLDKKTAKYLYGRLKTVGKTIGKNKLVTFGIHIVGTTSTELVVYADRVDRGALSTMLRKIADELEGGQVPVEELGK